MNVSYVFLLNSANYYRNGHAYNLARAMRRTYLKPKCYSKEIERD